MTSAFISLGWRNAPCATAVKKAPHFVPLLSTSILNLFKTSRAKKRLTAASKGKDPERTITDLLNDLVGKTGEKILIRRFVRFQVGEEIEG